MLPESLPGPQGLRAAFPFSGWRRLAPAFCLAAWLAGCASMTPRDVDPDGDSDAPSAGRGGTVGPAVGISGTPWAQMSAAAKNVQYAAKDLAWEVFRVPGKQPTLYSHVQHQGREAVVATADATGSILRHRRRVEPADLGTVHFSWNVPPPGLEANQALPQLEDLPVRVVLAFEGDRSRLSLKNAMLSELSLLLTGEEMPFATLVYTWSRTGKPGDVVFNDRTDRIRKLVVDASGGGYDQWRNYERDIRADYRRAFGEDPGALLSMAVFTEGERDEGRLRVYYGPLQLQPGAVFAASSPNK